MDLKRVIERTDTSAGRFFDLTIQTLIILSLIAFSIETLPNLSPTAQHLLRGFEIATVLVFSAEYLLRLLVAERKLAYVFSFYGLVDLFAILPFYVASGIDLRAIRVFRLFRLLRMFKLVRYTRALDRFRRAIVEVKEELMLYLAATAFLLFLASVGIYYCEHEAQPETFGSVFHCLWWAVATFTTVGYGDVYPVTVGGKVFTFFMLVLGLGVVAVPPGLLASALTKVRQSESEGES